MTNATKQWIYLDNSATTALSEEAVAAMREAVEQYANPSSLHAAGQGARMLVERARTQAAAALGVKLTRPSELVFTASGTEASNLAILGSVYAKERRIGRRIITTDCEHPSVAEAMARLERDGFEVLRIPAPHGVLDTEAAIRALDTPTVLVSMMLVNNETGAQFDVASVFRAAKQRNPETVTHCDAVQGFLKVPMTPAGLGADLVTVSAHKIHGPKGVGALYIAPEILRGKRISPILYGGGQENGLRSGTENVIGICGFGAAAAAEKAAFSRHAAHMTALRDMAEQALEALGLTINRPAGARAPHIVSVTLPGIKSQTMLNYLSAHGICVSSGSACSSHARHVSASLASFGLTDREADCTLRISLSSENTEADITALREALAGGLSTLVRIRH